MTDISNNIWVITIIGGAAAALIAGFFLKEKGSRVDVKNDNTQTNNQNTVVTTNVHIAGQKAEAVEGAVDRSKVIFFKESAKILFIDDLDLKDKIKNLENAGWKNVIQLEDAHNIDRKEIRESDIIFVDYKGIGMTSEKQGLGVLTALRESYKDSKWLILYTAHELPVDAFNIGANSVLGKNSSVYELEQKIIEGLGKIQK